MAKYKNNILQLKTLFQALGDANRLRIVAVLQHYETLCVCQLVELLQLANSTVSKHISLLKQAGIIESEKRGRWVYCRLNHDADSEWGAVHEAVLQQLAHDQQTRTDHQTMKSILRIPPEELCRRQQCRCEPEPAKAKSKVS